MALRVGLRRRSVSDQTVFALRLKMTVRAIGDMMHHVERAPDAVNNGVIRSMATGMAKHAGDPILLQVLHSQLNFCVLLYFSTASSSPLHPRSTAVCRCYVQHGILW